MAGATEATEVARAGLYERLLGDAWGDLEESVRGFHECGDAGARAAGTFAVRRGTGTLARLLARLLGLPRSGASVPLRLTVTPLAGGGECWRRNFAGRDFTTEQRAHAPALLAERAGPFETLFRLTAEGGALAYRQAGASLRAGRLKVPLPKRLAPSVEAWERACEGGVSVSVRVSSPLAGLLIEYEGVVRTEGDSVLTEEDARC